MAPLYLNGTIRTHCLATPVLAWDKQPRDTWVKLRSSSPMYHNLQTYINVKLKQMTLSHVKPPPKSKFGVCLAWYKLDFETRKEIQIVP